MEAPLAIVDKRRTDINVAEVMHVIGDVRGKTCLIIDDIIDTAGTLVKTVDALYANGAATVYACASHAVLSGPAIDRIANSRLEQVVVTNTVPLREAAQKLAQDQSALDCRPSRRGHREHSHGDQRQFAVLTESDQLLVIRVVVTNELVGQVMQCSVISVTVLTTDPDTDHWPLTKGAGDSASHSSKLRLAARSCSSVPESRKRETEMPEVVVAKPREGKFNKNAARRVRVAGKIPAVLYGSGHDPVAIEVDPKQISRILFSETGHNTIFDVESRRRMPRPRP